jgi:hypothetical protein
MDAVLFENYKKMSIKAILRIVSINFILISLQANAEVVLEQQASISLGSNFYSNYEMVDNQESVWIYNATPQYKLSLLDGVNTWYANGALRVDRSTNQDIYFNREDPSVQVGWLRDLEKGNFGVNASYSESSTRTRQFRETGLVQEDGTDRTRSVSANWLHFISEKLSMALDGGYEKTNFSLASGGESNTFTDSSLRYLNTIFRYKLTETISPYTKLGINDYRALTRIQFQNLLVGVVLNPTQKLTFDVSVGNTHFSETGDNAWIGALMGNYIGERYTIDGVLSRSVIATDVGDTELTDLLSFNYAYDISEKSRWGAALALGENKSSNANKTQQISTFYSRDLSSSWLMNLYLEMRNIKNESQSSVHGNTAGITFTYTTPKF